MSELQRRSNRLPVLAASIRDHLLAANGAMRRGVEHAIAAGLLLLEAKEIVGHGDWLPWLQANCEIGPRQAQTYMRLARNRHKLEALKTRSDAFLTIAAAEALVGRPKPERPHGLPGQLDLLSGEEVNARRPVLRRHGLLYLIIDLEQALAVLERVEATRRSKKYQSGLRAAASTIADAIAYLKQRRRPRRIPR
jgi:Protein of unknown function (DUF3102)